MTILVTGAGKGLGAEICRHLATNGHDVAIHYRFSKEEAILVAEECRQQDVSVDTIQGDFDTPASLDSFIAHYLDRFPDTKGLVNNVGNYLLASSTAATTDQWFALFQTNFFASVFLTNALLPSLKAHRGSVVNLGVTGLQMSRAFTKATVYAATKSALLFYTVSLAKELAKDFVRVNMVSPGYLENGTDLKNPSELPFNRPAYLHEVAHVVASFFDPQNVYITGQNIEVAGGIGL